MAFTLYLKTIFGILKLLPLENLVILYFFIHFEVFTPHLNFFSQQDTTTTVTLKCPELFANWIDLLDRTSQLSN